MKMKWTVNATAGLMIFAFFITLLTFTTAGTSTAWAAEKFMADRHTDHGVKCADCHKQNPPNKDVLKEDCFKCHGPDYSNLKKKTSNVVVNGEKRNPHSGHQGNLQCDNCHHAHKAPEKNPEEYCGACHNIGFSKVP